MQTYIVKQGLHLPHRGVGVVMRSTAAVCSTQNNSRTESQGVDQDTMAQHKLDHGMNTAERVPPGLPRSEQSLSPHSQG